MEVVDNCEVILPNWSVRMKRRKTSMGKDKEVEEVKIMLSGIETITNLSWGQLIDGFALALFQLAFSHPHFNKGQEYIWIPLLPVIKSYDSFSFERFMTKLKLYLNLQGGVVKIELDLHEESHEIDIVKDRMVGTINDVYAPQEAMKCFVGSSKA
ncbi:hypothetical protein M9H77_06766 [Catharanthus roseus]|uniref:Uncharacterized protein n=1 Tax=Catharanthus roseus TaxID=4058 RepID=A0ACC0BT48_CATRO|nr:hypothetical protein M9H77_06766 [Catharanthus roseus]